MASVTITLTEGQAAEISILLDMRVHEARRMSEDAVNSGHASSADYWSAISQSATEALAAVKQGMHGGVQTHVPARIPEPGLWGVVRARIPNAEPDSWVRTEKGWSNAYTVHNWDDLVDPVLVRKGAPEASEQAGLR